MKRNSTYIGEPAQRVPFVDCSWDAYQESLMPAGIATMVHINGREEMAMPLYALKGDEIKVKPANGERFAIRLY